MDRNTRIKRVLRKIWYGAAIALSVLVLLLSTVGVIGTWVMERTLVDVTQSLLGAAINTAGGLQRIAGQIDQGVGEVRQISSSVSEVSLRLSQNIEDRGLILTLLPAEQEEKLTAQIGQIQETLNTIRDFLTAGINIYRSVNRLPFVDLPEISQESVDQLEQSVAESRATVQNLRQQVQDVRSGVSSKIDIVTQTANRLTAGMDALHERLYELEQNLVALQDFALRMQQTVPLAFGLIAVLLTLLFAYVIYTQVEIIRLLIGRWKAIGTLQDAGNQPEVDAGS